MSVNDALHYLRRHEYNQHVHIKMVPESSWRKIRNNIAHQYEDEPQHAAEALNAIYVCKAIMETIYSAIKNRFTDLQHKYDFHGQGQISGQFAI